MSYFNGFLNGKPYLDTAYIGTGLFGDGSAAAPSVAGINYQTTGLFWAVNKLGISVGGSETASFVSNGGITLTALGSNQNVQLLPSGTGRVLFGLGGFSAPGSNGAAFAYSDAGSGMSVGGRGSSTDFQILNKTGGIALCIPTGTQNTLLGGLATNGTGVLQFPAATTSAGGITFGTDMQFYRVSSSQMTLNTTGASNCVFRLAEAGTDKSQLAFNTNALYIDTLTAGHSINFRSGNTTVAMTLGSDQVCTHAAGVVFSAPRTIAAATGTVAATDNFLIVNNAGVCTLTLGTATAGRVLHVRTITANTVVSASSNVVPAAGGAAGTAILAATAGKWATLQGDGTNWQIQASN